MLPRKISPSEKLKGCAGRCGEFIVGCRQKPILLLDWCGHYIISVMSNAINGTKRTRAYDAQREGIA
jgi:hypothetical protein